MVGTFSGQHVFWHTPQGHLIDERGDRKATVTQRARLDNQGKSKTCSKQESVPGHIFDWTAED